MLPSPLCTLPKLVLHWGRYHEDGNPGAYAGHDYGLAELEGRDDTQGTLHFRYTLAGFTWDVDCADLAQSWWHCGEVTAAMMAGVSQREACKVSFMKRRDAYKTGKPIYSTKSKAQ